MKPNKLRACCAALLALILLSSWGPCYGAAASAPLDPAELLALPFPAENLAFDVQPLHFRLVVAKDLPGNAPKNELNGLPACMVGFSFGDDFSEEGRAARRLLYGAATLLAQDGNEYGVYSSGAYEHDRWDLYFGLPEACSIYDSVLILRLPDDTITWPLGGYEHSHAKRRPTATGVAAGGSAEPQLDPVPLPLSEFSSVEAAALAEAERVVAEVKADAEEPWARALLDSLRLTIDQVGNADKKGYTPVTVSATMSSFHSGLKSEDKLGKRDAAELLRGALDHAEQDTVRYSLKLSVNLTDAAEPLLRWGSDNNQKGLGKFVATKATAARKSFEVGALREAVAALLLDEAASKSKLDVSQGLASAVFSGSVSRNTRALDTAQTDAYNELTSVPLANGWDRDAIRGVFDGKYVSAQKKSSSGKTLQEFDFAVDLAALAESGRDSCPGALAFAAQPDPYDDNLDALCEMVWALPDYPRPETGRLKGESRGTKVTIKIGNDPGDVFVRFVHAESEKLQVSCYIREGDQCVVRVPRGDYEMRYGRGDASDWQGEANAFGEAGDYGYGDINIMGSDYEHTVTLAFRADGNMPVSGTSLDGFLGR